MLYQANFSYMKKFLWTSWLILDFFSGSASTGHAVMDLNIKDNGKETTDMDTESKYGKMALNIKAIGKITKKSY